MSRQGHILVIGGNERAQALIRDRQGDRYRFTCCAEGNHAGISKKQERCYDWVVINGEMLGGDETDLIQSFRAMGFFSGKGGWSGSQRCGVEWLADGSLQLHCCAQAQGSRGRAVTGQALDGEAKHFIFEYHAPVKRTG